MENKIMVKAVFISFNEVVCPVPETGSYIVQVSNDNHMFTPESIFTVYDDECHTCEKPGKCDFKVNL
jgi:hypothetical protein